MIEFRTGRWKGLTTGAVFVAATAACTAFALLVHELLAADVGEASASPAIAASSAPAPARRAEPVIVREIRVLVACDEEFRNRRSNWRERAESLVRLASTPWEREFGVRWKPVSFAEWTTDDAAETLNDLHEHLSDTVKFADEDVVLGVTGQNRASGASATYELLGLGSHFGRVAVACVDRPYRWGGEPHTVAHEFGHLLGAWHCIQRDTIMSTPSSDLTTFDAQTRALIPLVRGFDFRAGADCLDDATIAKINAVWMAGRTSDAPHPVAGRLIARGGRRTYAGELETGLADFQKALSILTSCGVTRGKQMSACLIKMARACASRVPPDPKRVLEYARRARDAAEEDEEPVAVSWIALGHALWANDRHAESIDAYAQALRLRRARHGATHRLTNEARRGVEWYASRGYPAASAVLARESEILREAEAKAKTAGKR